MVLRVKSAATIDDEQAVADRILEAADRLFYAHGFGAVSVHDIRSAAGTSLKRLYALFPSKEALLVGALARRDQVWRQRVRDYVAAEPDPQRRLLAVFDCLHVLFQEDDFRGCAWINAYGELGAVSTDVSQLAQGHKTAFRHLIAELVDDAGLQDNVTDQLALLVEGALATAGINRSADPAAHARQAAATLIAAARSSAT